MPPLRERGADIEMLAQHFLDRLNEEEGTSKAFSPATLAALYAHSWPGNVRELKNYVHRAYILADKVIDVEFAPEAVTASQPTSLITVRIGSTLEEVNRRLIEATLAECGNVKRKAAETLGISLKTLYNRLAVYNGVKSAVPTDDAEPEADAPAASPVPAETERRNVPRAA
jgi:DNA-binding NtrC family response regulator